jgi:hypothetical protein
MTHPRIEAELAVPCFAEPASVARTVDRGVYVMPSEAGETVIFGVTSKHTLVFDGPIVLAPGTNVRLTARLLWRNLNLVDPVRRIVAVRLLGHGPH